MTLSCDLTGSDPPLFPATYPCAALLMEKR